MNPELNRAVANAVELVNTHSGKTCVWLRYADEPLAMDFVANSAIVDGAEFQFNAGFETYSGQIEDLAEIRAQVIEYPN